MNTTNKTLLVTLLTALSMTATAGHHESGEKAMDHAKDKGEKAMMEKKGDARAELESMRKDVDEAEVKAQIDAAQAEADMSKLQDDAEEAAEEAAPE